MNAMTLSMPKGQLSARFKALPVETLDELSAGVSSGYGIIGYRGKVWTIKYKNDETPLMREDGDGPRASIEVVIVRAATVKSKTYYAGGYVQGSDTPPDCSSRNGVTPEPDSPSKQSNQCATCKQNMRGSRINENGTAVKACADSKRLAVVPLADLHNEAAGGPMLLRVPADSLEGIASFGEEMKRLGVPYYAVGARISFDHEKAYPKFVVAPVRMLTDAEADIVLALRDDFRVQNVLSQNEFLPAGVTATLAVDAPAAAPKVAPAPAPKPVPVETPEEIEAREFAEFQAAKKARLAAASPAPAPAPAKVAAPKAATPKPAPKPVPAPVAAPVEESDLGEDDLDAQLAMLLPK